MQHTVIIERYIHTHRAGFSRFKIRQSMTEANGGGCREERRKRTDNRSWRELNPVLRVLGSDKFVPPTHRFVKTRDVGVRYVTKGASVVIVPSHCKQVSGGVVFEWCVSGTIKDPGFPCGVGGDRDCGEEVVRIWVEIAEDRCDVETVDEEGGSTCAVGVLE